jgi:hypothetical protein
MPYRFFLLSIGFFVGSLVGRDAAFELWGTTIAAAVMLVSGIGCLARKTKPEIAPKEKHDYTH